MPLGILIIVGTLKNYGKNCRNFIDILSSDHNCSNSAIENVFIVDISSMRLVFLKKL